MKKLFLYGPPGSGKSAAGVCLADALAIPFFDLDQEIEASTGRSIPDIFASQGEAGFRSAERRMLERMLEQPSGSVISLGAGALLDEASRGKAEAAGKVICLTANQEVLHNRLKKDEGRRPLLAGDTAGQLESLLKARSSHYASFPNQIDTNQLTPQEAAWQAQIQAGCFFIRGMGSPYPVLVEQNGLEAAGQLLAEQGLKGPVAIVSDRNVANLYEERVMSSLQKDGFECRSIVLPPGEAAKNLATVSSLWEAFIEARLDRGSTVLAVGGGVVTDLAGFAAATYLRGIPWAALPTTLLGMVDASLGGKTGIDLPQGKNLAGAFHAPGIVAAFPELLASLPPVELRNGMAEVVKHGLIADPILFQECAQGWDALSNRSASASGDLISRAVAVKARFLLEDPYEKGRRAVLNYGHTAGHALEQASGYSLRHGEAVAVGMVVEARIGEALGVSEPGLAEAVRVVLEGLRLPTKAPQGLAPAEIRRALMVDKKHRDGKARLSLPTRIGYVQDGYEIEEEKLWTLFLSCMDPI